MILYVSIGWQVRNGTRPPFVQSCRGRLRWINFRKIAEKLRHCIYDGQNTLIESEKKTTHRGGECSGKNDPIREYVFETWRFSA